MNQDYYKYKYKKYKNLYRHFKKGGSHNTSLRIINLHNTDGDILQIRLAPPYQIKNLKQEIPEGKGHYKLVLPGSDTELADNYIINAGENDFYILPDKLDSDDESNKESEQDTSSNSPTIDIKLLEPDGTNHEVKLHEPYLANTLRHQFREVTQPYDLFLAGEETALTRETVLEDNMTLFLLQKVSMPITSKDRLIELVKKWCEGVQDDILETYGHISDWNVSQIDDMSFLFHGKTEFNDNINNWNVSNVTNMRAMFFDNINFNQPLDTWDVSSVTDMASMFKHASKFNQPLDDWKVGKVIDITYMFYNAYSFNQPLEKWGEIFKKNKNIYMRHSMKHAFDPLTHRYGSMEKNPTWYIYKRRLKSNLQYLDANESSGESSSVEYYDY